MSGAWTVGEVLWFGSTGADSGAANEWAKWSVYV